MIKLRTMNPRRRHWRVTALVACHRRNQAAERAEWDRLRSSLTEMALLSAGSHPAAPKVKVN